MLTLYGQVMSRAQRTLWLLEELEVPFEHEKVNQNAGETRTTEFMKLNPNGHVPVLKDGDLVLWETIAINWHIAAKHGAGSLWPSDQNQQSQIMQWSLWMTTELENLLVDYLRHAIVYPEDKRNPALAEAAKNQYPVPMKVLDDSLQGRDYLVGDSFTLADLNVASMLGLVDVYKQFDNSEFPTAVAWLEKMLARPARAKALART
ncbi:MAG: glutathione S-transferase family protein [Gammaproteobacteria bacterium]